MIVFDEGKDSDRVYRRLAEGENAIEAMKFFQEINHSTWKEVRVLEVYMISKDDFNIMTGTTAEYDDLKAIERIKNEANRVAKETYKYDKE